MLKYLFESIGLTTSEGEIGDLRKPIWIKNVIQSINLFSQFHPFSFSTLVLNFGIKINKSFRLFKGSPPPWGPGKSVPLSPLLHTTANTTSHCLLAPWNLLQRVHLQQFLAAMGRLTKMVILGPWTQV